VGRKSKLTTQQVRDYIERMKAATAEQARLDAIARRESERRARDRWID
jgi:hypothetical protein